MIGKRIAWCAIATLAMLHTPVSAQDKPPVMLTPASAWNVNYAEDSCRLARTFTDGTDNAAFVIDQFEPGPSMNVTVASKAFRNHADGKVSVGFGPAGGHLIIDRPMRAEFGSFGPSVTASGIGLMPDDDAIDDEEKWVADGNLPKLPTPEQAQAISWFEVRRGNRQAVRFALGPMHTPMAALHRCTEELLSHWGIDAAAHKMLTQRAVPSSNPGKWVSNSDYPKHLAMNGVQGLIQFRLLIDAAGTVTSCHIQQSTRPAEFDKKVCDIMSKRARFKPALDAGGKPINSYWRSSFRFVID